MKRLDCYVTFVLLAGLAFSQSSDSGPAFEASDVRVSMLTSDNQFRRGPQIRGGRYELHTATMVDLVAIAYGVDNDKVLGGPSWLEMSRFDVVAKMPPESTLESVKPALQHLLADRFKLVAHKDMKPLPAYVLLAGKKPLLKEATGKEETGCKPQSSGGSGGGSGPGGGTNTIMMFSQDGVQTSFTLGPGNTIQFNCRNMSMASFASGLRRMIGANLGTNDIADQTGLEGRWNFDVSWTLGIGRNVDAAERISVFDAMDKQLGLKLEQKPVPTPVVVVDSVNEKPTPNAPDLEEHLKIPPPPTEFEVAALKPSNPDSKIMFRMQTQPGGRVNIQGYPLGALIREIWNINNDMLVNAPGWLDSDRFDIIAKVPTSEQVEMEQVYPLLRALIADRFKMTTHTEERQITGYTLVSVKPKMKKADAASRTHIQNIAPNDPLRAHNTNPALNRFITYQNVSMAQFADSLMRMAGGYIHSPVLDSTGIEGGFDFNLTFSVVGQVQGVGGGRKGGGDSAVGDAAEPSGAISLFEAIEKELGLKLEPQKRTGSVLVIDHIERKPTEN